MSDRYRRIKTEHDLDRPSSFEEAAATQLPLGDDSMLFSGRMARLLVLSPEDGCWEIELLARRVVIGRLEECAIHLPLPSISRRHATITREEGSWIIRDLGSSSGTTINGRPLPADQRRLLHHGDTIQLSRVVMQFRRDERRLRSDGSQAMDFFALPASVGLRLRRLHIAPIEVFDPGDTLPIGRHAGGFSVVLPADSGLEDCSSVIEVELTYPDGRMLTVLAEPVITYPAGDSHLLCIKLHKIDRDTHGEIVRRARRNPWLTPRNTTG